MAGLKPLSPASVSNQAPDLPRGPSQAISAAALGYRLLVGKPPGASPAPADQSRQAGAANRWRRGQNGAETAAAITASHPSPDSAEHLADLTGTRDDNTRPPLHPGRDTSVTRPPMVTRRGDDRRSVSASTGGRPGASTGGMRTLRRGRWIQRWSRPRHWPAPGTPVKSRHHAPPGPRVSRSELADRVQPRQGRPAGRTPLRIGAPPADKPYRARGGPGGPGTAGHGRAHAAGGAV